MFSGYRLQVLLFIYLYIGYVLYIFNRRSFGFMIPIIKEKDDISNDSIGTILSSLATAYALGKFLSGMLVDRFSSRLMFSIGLFSVGICNLLFSIASPTWFPILWFLNGLTQGPGWPASAKILRRWYAPEVFGSLWSVLSTSMNLPATIGPLLCSAYIASNDGYWRPVMRICGTMSCGYALLVFFLIYDRPEDVGLTLQALQGKSDVPSNKKQTSAAEPGDSNDLKNDEKIKNISKQEKKLKQNAWSAIFSSFYTYVISIGFLMTTLIKGILSDWSSLYLIQNKSADRYHGGVFIAWYEIGGIVGSIFSGYVSDKLIQYFGRTQKGNARHYMYIAWLIMIVACMHALQTIEDVKSDLTVMLILSFLLGFFVYGNLSLCGVLTIENAADSITGTVHAFCALFGNVGLVMSGLPFSKLVGYVGWENAFQATEIATLMVAVLFVVSQRFSCRIGFKQKEE